MPENDKGYYKKYTVIDNRTGEEVKETTFVLNLGTDPAAKVALQAYAQEIMRDNPTLYADLMEMIL